MAAQDKPESQPTPGRNLLPDEADGVAGAIPPPTDVQEATVPEPGLNLEIETLDGATAGATNPTANPTIRVKINANLDEAD